MNDFGQFLFLDLLKGLTFTIKCLECFDDGFGHTSVGFLGAAHNGKSFRLGDSFVAIRVIKADP